ncbi:hypothetical protein [Amphritea sp.]
MPISLTLTCGVAMLLVSVIAGLLCSGFGAPVTFYVGAGSV